LINAGVPNKVVSLKDGTMAWHLAGYEVVNGATRRPPDVSSSGVEAARHAARSVAELMAIPSIDAAALAAWQSESATRSLYVLDVRTPEEYAAGHVRGVRSAPGGQLVQETDNYLATWGARVVLTDADGVRAIMTASWLKQMGWEVVIADNETAGGATERGPFRARVLGLDDAGGRYIGTADLQHGLAEARFSVVDLDYSRQYLQGHIPGAHWALRSRLDTDLASLPADRPIVFTSDDGALAALAASDHAADPRGSMALQGGTRAWRDAGLPLSSGPEHMASAVEDIRLKAREQSSDIEAAMRAYLAWEINLVNDMATDDDQRFEVVTG
ncbi:MAG: hypothetical protein KDK91_24710, partial [Gammaproteobacteria bacterium]|nr:hypothetical protein [Gammaproteobacteria bacterium]